MSPIHGTTPRTILLVAALIVLAGCTGMQDGRSGLDTPAPPETTDSVDPTLTPAPVAETDSSTPTPRARSDAGSPADLQTHRGRIRAAGSFTSTADFVVRSSNRTVTITDVGSTTVEAPEWIEEASAQTTPA